MSIDLFFFAAPFLCRDQQELRPLSRRIALGILVAGICFLIYPLNSPSNDRRRRLDRRPLELVQRHGPAVQPVAVAAHHAAHDSRRPLRPPHGRRARVATHVWFSLIGFSTLFTYQHHVVDVIGGFILATFCFYLVSDVPWRLPMVPNRASAGDTRRWAVLVRACAPLRGRVARSSFGRRSSRRDCHRRLLHARPEHLSQAVRPVAVERRIVMAPVLIGQYLSLLYYKRQCRPWDEVAPGVWIGRRLNDAEADDGRASRASRRSSIFSGEFSEARAILEARVSSHSRARSDGTIRSATCGGGRIH